MFTGHTPVWSSSTCKKPIYSTGWGPPIVSCFKTPSRYGKKAYHTLWLLQLCSPTSLGPPIFLVAFSPSAKDSRWWFPNPPLLAFNAASRPGKIRSTRPLGWKIDADWHFWWRRNHSQPTFFSYFLGLKWGYERLVCGCLDCLDHGFHQTFRVDQHIWSLRIWFVNQVLICFNH